jgi:hypothetical protein
MSNANTEFIPLERALQKIGRKGESLDVIWERLRTRLKTGTVRSKSAVQTLVDWTYGQPETITDADLQPEYWVGASTIVMVDANGGVVTLTFPADEAGGPFDMNLHGLRIAEADISDLFKPKESGGRPPSNTWPAFAEEMAFYFVKEGAPDLGTPLARVIGAIFDAMAERGKDTPSEQTARPVVEAIIERIRNME